MVWPVIKLNATIAPAKTHATTATSTSQVLLSMTSSMTCLACGRYGVFTPNEDAVTSCLPLTARGIRR